MTNFRANYHRMCWHAWSKVEALAKRVMLYADSKGWVHYKQVPLTHLYVSDYEHVDVVMHSGYYPGE